MTLLSAARRRLMTTLTFAVRRREAELVGPARPTPRETKRLSDIDDQMGLRWHVPLIFLYRGGGGHHEEVDPVRVVRRALSEALVPYYPLAGRLREVEGRKLVVDCTGDQGVLFVEADADARLPELEAAGLMRPPFPCMDQLLFDVDGSDGVVVNTPLLLIQVTRLLCGGFVLALRLNHTMCDGAGIVQFMSAVGELARGLPAPTVAAVWRRELLDARTPPTPSSFAHPEYDAEQLVPPPPPPPGDMVTRTFVFSPADVAAIKKQIHLRDKATTTFEAVAAALWLARTAALDVPAGEDARLAVVAGVRGVRELGLPAGYYGNACVFPAAVAAAGALRLGDAAELVRAAKKAAASAEYVRSSADLLVRRGRPQLALANLLVLSDVRRAGFLGVDLGWGQPVYGGPAAARFGVSFLVAVDRNNVAVPVVLPPRAMDRFASELNRVLNQGDQQHSRL